MKPALSLAALLVVALFASFTADAKTHRDPKQRAEFMRSNPCPATGKTHGSCPGYIVDHVIPLKRGGADRPSNMQWQSKDAAKRKDKWE